MYAFHPNGRVRDFGAVMLALIAAIAVQIGVDARLAQELALHENPSLDPTTVGRSGDLGMFQLNPQYLDYFVERYWVQGKVENVLGSYERFDWRNPRHNTFIGVSILYDLIRDDQLNTWQALIAYNCGRSRTLSGNPPNSSIEAANKVFARWQRGGGLVLK